MKDPFSPEARSTYARWLEILESARVDYAIGGAYSLGFHTDIWRDTKDLDVFITPSDLQRVLEVMQEAGFWTTVKNPFWLAKVRSEQYFMDLIFGLSNQERKIDRSWITNSIPAEVFGVRSRVLGLEEFIASKIYVLRRDRFDGSDIAHVIRAIEGKVDWERVMDILGRDRQLLLFHLLLFDYVYPGHSGYLPRDLMVEIFEKARHRWDRGERQPDEFFGMRVDPEQFKVDLERFQYSSETPHPLVDKEGAVV